jgi:hypothetical protein
MIARIALGAKCSKAMVGIHFTDNPGVSVAVKTYLNIKMKCARNEAELKQCD